MNIKAIGISAALISSTMVAGGVTVANQNYFLARGDEPKLNLEEKVSSGNFNQGSLNQESSNKVKTKRDRGNSKNDKGETKQVPTPALLPGLIALGVGVLRKRKAEEAEVDDSKEKV